MEQNTSPNRIVTLAEWQGTHGVVGQLARRWALAGRLAGAYQSPPGGGKGSTWLLPLDTPRPVETRGRRMTQALTGEDGLDVLVYEGG